MMNSRTTVRASRAVRVQAQSFRQPTRRFADTSVPNPNTPGSSNNASGGSSNALLYGAVGGAAASSIIFFTYYQYTGVGKAVQTAKSMKQYVDSSAEQLKVQFKQNTPEPSEALETLRQTANKYATFIPGGREYVDKVFKDLELIRNKHGAEVDEVVSNCYSELRDVSKKGLSLETATETWSVLSKYLQQLSSLAVDAGDDVLNNHPELKNRLGGSYDQLKQFGDQLGPEAKKQVDQTYQEIRDVINQGLQLNTVDRIRKLVQDKVQSLKELRDKAWKQGYEQIQPMMKDNPQIKKTVEENIDTLRNGNIAEALDKVKQAVKSGDAGSLNEYIESAKNKADQFSSSSLSSWLSAIPGGSQILPQIQKLKQVAESRGPEAEKLAKETLGDIQKVLDKRSDQIEDLYKKAKEESKD